MILEILFCILSFGTCHEWRQRPIEFDSSLNSKIGGSNSRVDSDNKVGKAFGKFAGSVTPRARHEQGFYQDGTNSGYFREGVRSDSKENLNKYNTYKPQSGEITRKPELMKEAERNVEKDFRSDNYVKTPLNKNFESHNCHDYKEAVNKEYGELVKEKGL